MLSALATLPIISSSITGAIAAFYLVLFLKKPDQTIYLKFAITVIMVLFYSLASIGLYSSTEILDALTWRRIQTTALSLFTIFFLDFIFIYINYQKRSIVRIIQISALISIVLQIVITNDLTWKFSNEKVTTIQIFNQTAAFPDISPGIISIILFAIGIIAYLYVLFITFKHRAQISGYKQNFIVRIGNCVFFRIPE